MLRERQFPLASYGGTDSEVDCKFSYWVTCISRETTAVFLQLISAVTLRNGGLGREGIGTSIMTQLVDCTIDTSSFLRRERDECLFDARS